MRYSFGLLFRLGATVGLLAAGGGCGPSSKPGTNVCDGPNPPPACAMTCDPATGNCPGGFHCAADGTCAAECTPSGGECGAGQTCSSDGHCVDSNLGPDAACPEVTFTATQVTPSIGLLLDQSGSMYDDLGTTGVERFRAMRDALVGQDGVVTQLESQAYFGSMLYTTGNSCPIVDAVPRALNNADAIRASIDSRLGGGDGATPTPAAIDSMVAAFAAAPPPAGSPPIIVLATDGLPNSCSGAGNTETQSVAAARASYAAGIPLYVLAINVADKHFQDLADAGQGKPNAKYYPANDAAQLAAAFRAIISGAISCDLSITGTIDESQAQSGTVKLNGTTLTYGTDWQLIGGSTIRLLAGACSTLKSSPNPQVDASFPCGAVIL